MNKILAFVAALWCGLASAASTTTDFTDLWFNPNESGWGANVIHQRDTLFVTLFVYGESRTPVWYVASNVTLTSTANNVFTYSGELYRTSGPYFGGTFNPNNVSRTTVGTITFAASQINAATLTYVVDGVTVTKPIVRQTWAAESLTGEYWGAAFMEWTNCGGRSGRTEIGASFTFTHNTNNVAIRELGGNLTAPQYTCNYNGTYTQAGRTGTVTGTGTCTDGFNPAFVISEIDVNVHGLTARFAGTSGSCQVVGRIGGVRRN